MPSVARNSALNVFAFGVAAVVGVLLTPVLIGHYGIEAFGLIAISRLVLPNAAGGLLDLGLPEALVRMAAGDRSGPEASFGWRYGRIGLIATLLVGAFGAALLFASAEVIAGPLLGLAGGGAAEFADALRWTAIALVVLYPFALVEGWLKGLERFDLLRSTDIAFNVVFAAIVVGMVRFDTTVADVILVYLGLSVAKGLVLATGLAGTRRHRPGPWRADARELFPYAFASLFNKAVGIGLRYAPLLALAWIATASAVGLFEALSRVAYLAKTLLGSATSAVLPGAMRRADDMTPDLLWRKTGHATAVIGVAFVPGLLALGALGDFVLTAWLGAEIAEHWVWFALLMIWPATIACDLVRDAILSIDRSYLRLLGAVSVVQLAIVVILGLALHGLMGAPAFAVGLFAAALAGLLLRWIAARRRGVPDRLLREPIGGLAAAAAVCIAVAAAHEAWPAPWGASWWVAGGVALAIAWCGATAAYALVGMRADTRAAVLEVVLTVTRRR